MMVWFRKNLKYILYLMAGFFSLSALGLPDLKWVAGVLTMVWLLSFLALTGTFRTKKRLLLSGAVFLAGYLLRFRSAVDVLWLYFLLFPLVGLVFYGILLLYTRLLNRWNRLYMTLCLPAIYAAAYGLALLLRVPALLRLDVLFMGMTVLSQTQSVIGAFGLSCLVLFLSALLHFALRNRKNPAAYIAGGLYAAVILCGILYLYPNTDYESTVRVAYTTGPYVGNYLQCTALPLETAVANMEAAAREAADRGAGILVFTEEAFTLEAEEEAPFLERCCAAARENGLHMLVALDVGGSTAAEKSQNKLLWIDAEGQILGSYRKRYTVPVLESEYLRGDGEIPSHTITVNGQTLTVSYLICYDSNFPAYVRQMNPDTDILFLPSWDWEGVTELHAQLTRTLSVQNRVSILKCTYDGISLVTNPDGKIIHSTDTRELGFGAVQVTEVPIPNDAGTVITAPEKAGYIIGIIAAEIFSLLICVVLLGGNVFENRESSPRNRLFTIMVLSGMVGIGADALSWILDGCARMESVLYVCTFLSLAMTFVLSLEFIAYLTAYIQERQVVKPIFQRIYTGFALLAIIATFLLSLNGTLFRVENGFYADGPGYGAYVLINLLTVLMCMVAFIRYRRLLTRHDVLASVLYILIPGAAAVINVFVSSFSYVYPAMTLSLIIVYIMIQSERAQQLKRDEALSTYMATHDSLTGLRNRRAYEDTLSAIAASGHMAGVVFSDLNGLKYTNDTCGHDAGDRLLTDYAALLSANFRRDEIFRISGDEFVVLITDMAESAFSQRVEKFAGLLEQDGGQIACVGTEYGSGRDVIALLRQAEGKMYIRKNAYHAEHPEMQRQ